jgi:acetyltransferase-like isoleucine patch superfamily enzyme
MPGVSIGNNSIIGARQYCYKRCSWKCNSVWKSM